VVNPLESTIRACELEEQLHDLRNELQAAFMEKTYTSDFIMVLRWQIQRTKKEVDSIRRKPSVPV